MTLQEILEKELGPYEVWRGRKSLVEGNWRRLPIRYTMALDHQLSEADAAQIVGEVNILFNMYKITKADVTSWSLMPEYSLAVNKGVL